jgi:DNA damage-binding protein 1
MIPSCQVRTFPVGQHARRIVYTPNGKAFVVAILSDADDDDNNTFQLHVYDESTFELLDMSFRTAPHEIINSMHSCIGLGRDPRSLIVVTTSVIDLRKDDSTDGRVLVFEITPARSLQLISEKSYSSGVECVAVVGDNLAVTARQNVSILKWESCDGGASFKLQEEVTFQLHMHIVSMKVFGMNIFCGDIMKSVSLLKYNPDLGTLSEIAMNMNELWVTALQPVSETMVLVSDNLGNVFTMDITDDADRFVSVATSEMVRLESTGIFHLGDQINRFESGSLNLPVRDGDDGPVIPTTIFGTVSGRIGIIAGISEATFKTLRSVLLSFICAAAASAARVAKSIVSGFFQPVGAVVDGADQGSGRYVTQGRVLLKCERLFVTLQQAWRQQATLYSPCV